MTTPALSWQQAILAHFTPKRERMLLVIDPDNLLRDDALLAAIQNSNYDVLRLDDEVAFRNLFERAYRSRWDAGQDLHVVVVVHTTDGQRHIPYDLWQKGRRIELGVASLFPQLNAIVMRELDNAFYADLYPAHAELLARNELLRGERQTVEFILRVVFGLDILGAHDPVRWVSFLIQKHYQERELPPALEAYVAEHLLDRAAHAGLRAEFLNDGQAFFAWLGQQWATYVAQPAGSNSATIDFADPRLRPLLGSLFADGRIPRAMVPQRLAPEQGWMAVGLSAVQPGVAVQSGAFFAVRDQAAQTLYNLKAQLGRFQSLDQATLPAGKTDLRDWLNLAAEWAEVVYQANSLPLDGFGDIQTDLAAARLHMDGHFWAFLEARYSAVDYYEDNRGPLSVAAINRWLVQHVADRDERLALICFDGLALDQWLLLRDYLHGAVPGLVFTENRTYAVAPTITPISRQALFAGRPPTAFAETIGRTDKDAERWRAYWINHDVPAPRVAYTAVKVDGQGLDQVQAAADSRNRRLGVLVNLFDDVMHHVQGMPAAADKRVYYDTLRSHLAHGELAALFRLLLGAGYRVFITADHGNIAGVGIGLTPPKALVESYARRVALFDSEALARDYAATHGLLYFRTKALPPDVHPVYLPGVQLFGAAGATQISHGGLSLEELVVPYVEVSRP